MIFNWKRVRLNYGTTHQDPPPSTTTHHQPKYIHQHPLPTTTIHATYHQQNISTTTNHQPKYIHHYLPRPKEWTITLQKPEYAHI